MAIWLQELERGRQVYFIEEPFHVIAFNLCCLLAVLSGVRYVRALPFTREYLSAWLVLIILNFPAEIFQRARIPHSSPSRIPMVSRGPTQRQRQEWMATRATCRSRHETRNPSKGQSGCRSIGYGYEKVPHGRIRVD